MNQSICPLPFAPPSDKGVAEGPPLFPTKEESTSNDFGDLLDSELEDEPAKPKKHSEGDPWTIYGHAQPVIQLLQLVGPIAANGDGSISTMLETEVPPVLLDLTAESAKELSEDVPQEDLGSNDGKAGIPLETLFRVLKPGLQNVPPEEPAGGPQLEQTAAKALEAAKKTHGTAAAQEPSMLFANPKEEKSALQQRIALSDVGHDAAFNPEIQVKTNNIAPEGSRKSEFNLAEFTPVNAITPEWSSFEGATEISEVQAPRDIESLEIAKAIRTHVELLKTSNQDKMDVVLRPDGQTELRLQVEKVNGQILVQARCDRGDFSRLEANWSAVQQSLAAQGVRVEALQNGATLQNDTQHWNNSSSSSGQQFGSREENKTRFIEQELTIPNRPKETVASKGSARGWQSWA